MTVPGSQAVGSPAHPATRWNLLSGLRHNLWLLATLLLVLALHYPTTAALQRLWEDTDVTTYSHGYLILAVSLWLIVRDRPVAATAGLPASGRMAIAGMLAGASLGWLIAVLAGLQLVHQVLLPIIAWLAVLGAFGIPATRVMMFPLGFLYFAMPLWDSLNNALQQLSTVVVGWLVRIVGIPAWLEGNFVHIPGGTFEIAGGCSGLHYLVVGTAIAALYGEIHRDGLATRLKLLLLGVVLSLVTNWIRILIIIAIGHRQGMGHPWVQDHYTLGWVVFGIAMVGFFLLARCFPAPGETSVRAPAAPGALRPALPGGYVVAVALLIGPLWLLARPHAPAGPLMLPAFPDPAVPADAVRERTWQPVFPGADVVEHVRLAREPDPLEVLTVAYRTQSQGAELVGYGVDLPGPSQELLASTTVDGGGVRWREDRVQDLAGRNALIWSVYSIDGHTFVSGLPAQLWYGVSSLFGQPLSGLLAFRVPCAAEDCEGAREVLRDYAGERATDLRARLGRTLAGS